MFAASLRSPERSIGPSMSPTRAVTRGASESTRFSPAGRGEVMGGSQALVQDGYQVLQYNQQLVQFADSKAGTLILINSLFIAAAQASRGLTAGGFEHALQMIYIGLSCVAVLYCMAVVMCKADFDASGQRDLVFFGDILARQPWRYPQEFRETPADAHLEGVLRRAYVVASIAARKFERYVTAQKLTALSAVAWVGANVLALLH